MPGMATSGEPGDLVANISYVKRPSNGEPLETYLRELPDDKTRASNVDQDDHDTTITDLRTVPQQFSLERNGFKLARLEVAESLDWQDESEVKRLYYPRLQELLLKETGATRVHIFDHTIRNGSAKTSKELTATAEARRQPAVRAHVDYTLKSGQERLHVLLPDEAEKLSQTHYAVIQVWRPLAGPVEDSPLAMADVTTVDQNDLLTSLLHFPGRTGEVYSVAHNPAHRWYYAKGITTEEAYIFVCYDSRTDRARFTPHTAFVDPTTREDAPPRRSVESRAYVFWENEAP